MLRLQSSITNKTSGEDEEQLRLSLPGMVTSQLVFLSLRLNHTIFVYYIGFWNTQF